MIKGSVLALIAIGLTGCMEPSAEEIVEKERRVSQLSSADAKVRRAKAAMDQVLVDQSEWNELMKASIPDCKGDKDCLAGKEKLTIEMNASFKEGYDWRKSEYDKALAARAALD